MANPFQMPLRGTQNAPKFDGKSPAQLPRYLEDIEFLGTSAGLTDEEQIRAAIRYADLEEAEVWQTLPEAFAAMPDWRDFVTAVKDLYPGCEGDDRYCQADLQYLVQQYRTKPMQSQRDLGEYRQKFVKVTSLLIQTRKLSDTEKDDLFLRGFPPEVEDKIRHRLSIVKPDLHPDNPYPIADTNEAAKFLLIGSAFRSSIQTAIPTPAPAANTAPRPQPYQQSYQPPTHQPPAPQLSGSQVKQELVAAAQNQFRNQNCNFCGGLGHFTRACAIVTEYLQAGRVTRGQDGRLYFPDGSRIPRIPGLQYLQ